MKNLISAFALALSLATALTLTGCSAGASSASSSSDSHSSSRTEPASEPAAAPDLTGTWKQINSASEDSYQEAEISNNAVTINWVTDNGDTKSIYWIGTFTAPADAKTPYKWTSTRDKAATEGALLASQDDTKEFTFQDDTISYSASALGTTTTIKLKRG
jgi:hypothetical protein